VPRPFRRVSEIDRANGEQRAAVGDQRLGRELDRVVPASQHRSKAAMVLLRGRQLADRLHRRLLSRRRLLGLAPHGAVIAVIGPDASGKSTVVRELGNWFGEELAVFTAHAAKPPATALTILPRLVSRSARLARPLLSARTAGKAPTAETSEQPAPQKLGPYYNTGQSLAIAYDRQGLLTRLRRLAADGVLVITDRYPTPWLGGVIDGAQLDPQALSSAGHPGLARLARHENRLYQHLPGPDIVANLQVSLDRALERNAGRADG